MSTTTMHFGPEWMRTKHQPLSRSSQAPPSPPPSATHPSGASTYSALVSPAPPILPEKRDEAHPFRYSKEDMLRIYKEGGGKGGLGLEVERWEGVVREAGTDPVGARELSEAEKKLFAGPLNSDLRRRQSTDYLSPLNTNSLSGERPRLNHSSSSAASSPLRERFGALKRRDSTAQDSPTLTLPRKQSLSNLQPPLMSPREGGLPSPRSRVGYTPGFDGVLNSAESWTARRRLSETSLKPGIGNPREDQQEGKASGIREEKEEEEMGRTSQNKGEGESERQQASSHRLDSLHSTTDASHDPSLLERGANPAVSSQVPLNTNGAIPSDPRGGPLMNVGPPPGLQDLAAVEWSYKDPSGQVQGPFRADLMQKWYDDGYFSPDLPMKRTHLDTQWMTVEELAHRAGGEKIFLSPIVPVQPPGLNARNGSPMQNFGPPADHSMFNGPYQPAPIRTLRSSTLDSYLSTGSNPSDSPSSSFGAGRFADSPDPAAFGGRAAVNPYFVGDANVARGGNFGGPDMSSPFAGRRGAFNDPVLDARTGSFSNLVPGRGPGIDGYGYNNSYPATQGSWNPTPNMGPGFEATDSFPAFGPGSGLAPSPLNQAGHFNSMRSGPDALPTDAVPGNNTFGSIDYGGLGMMGNDQLPSSGSKPVSNFTNYHAYVGAGIVGPEQQYSHQPVSEYAQAQQFQHPSPALPLNSHSANQNPNTLLSSSPTPWSTVADLSASRRPGPFEVPHPTAANTVVAPPAASSQNSPWGRNSQPSPAASQTNELPPWVAASQGIVEDAWKGQPAPDSLTVSNVGQHNQLQQQLDSAVVDVVDTLSEALEQAPGVQTPPEPAPAPEDPAIVASVPLKQKAKAPQAAPEPAVKLAPSPTIAIETAVPPPAAVQKTPWAKEDDTKKVKPSTASVSLREIQEAEAKKADARKAAERERERATRAAAAVAAASETKEESQSFTASWGLPTSQAGARSNALSKDVSTPTMSAATATPVWTSAVKAPVAKKTMKEIQEEEERRKKATAKETMAVAAARRAYAESTNKGSAPVSAQGSAWTTVGPSGKASAPVAALARPAAVTASATGALGSAQRSNGTPAVRSTAAAPVPKPVIPVARVEEHLASPSHDFLKWLNESLKGLNSSVNVEEIMSMLLSFPMDPDSSTLELISDLIYANSTTLDGRRFASEFVNKRKADALARAKGSAVSGKLSAKPVSIADVVKAAPKATQPEWGFKVVNKKKKGGRA